MTALEPARRVGRLVRRTLAGRGAVDEIHVDLVDALARAERAEAEVDKLRRELIAKDEVLREARKALLTARVALREQLRQRDP